jgi:predicted TIM-barrel fold metal-dependent hydrolase
MSISTIQAIDVHAHFGKYDRGKRDIADDFMTGDADLVVRRARQANTRLTMVSPLEALLPRFGGDPTSGNVNAARIVAETDGLLQWVVIDPLKPHTYAQAEEMLRLPKCVGVKIHPEEHGYPIREHGHALFEFAAKHQAVVLAHSSEQNSLAADYVSFANDFPDMKLILAHIGCGWDGDLTHQARAVQQSKHGNVFTDTSSAKSITPNLIEWTVHEIGANRVLYGTDSPLYFAPMQRARIDHADLSDREKKLILCENAVRILPTEKLNSSITNLT